MLRTFRWVWFGVVWYGLVGVDMLNGKCSEHSAGVYSFLIEGYGENNQCVRTTQPM